MIKIAARRRCYWIKNMGISAHNTSIYIYREREKGEREAGVYGEKFNSGC